MAIKKRIVVVGLGSIGMRHARLLKERNDVDVEVLELNPLVLAAAEKSLGKFTCHENFKQMLSTTPDIVWLSTPTHLHAEHSIAALNANAHVFCEKPMTVSLDEARKLQTVVVGTGLVFNVGFHLHFSYGMLQLKKIIEEKELGNILHIYSRVGTYVTLVNSVSRYQSNNPGSLFFDYAHQVDLIYWLLQSKPVSVYVPAFTGGNLELKAYPNVADIICEYKSPLLSHIHLNYVQMPQRHEYEIIGDEGWAILDMEQQFLKIGYRRSQIIKTINFNQDRDDVYRAEHQAFLDAVNFSRKPESSVSDGMISTALCVAIMNSWKSGEKIFVPY